ncbi:MAG: DUF1543 domain-containing protein [Ferruginibacter sp.]|nr:DUF1543 domain-containing protein [Ferruginibacter sp.]
MVPPLYSNSLKLFMVLLGCKPPGRHTEQHDTFFGIAPSMKDLVPELIQFWPESKGKIHVDGWREVNQVDGFDISIAPISEASSLNNTKLFFINLGGYKRGEFEEFHYKMIVAAPDKGAAIRTSKETAFYKHTGFKGATSHVDDKYGIDVDDLYELADILPKGYKEQYVIQLTPALEKSPDIIHLGYFKLDKL